MRGLRSLSAKLLLFGEHAVLEGGTGLATSWSGRTMRWRADASDSARAADSRRLLEEFIAWLDGEGLGSELDLVAARDVLTAGEWLDTDIPIGYGLGSSGAACAAVADRFGPSDLGARDAGALRELFARMEACFHGKSSGIDPLVIFLDRALRFRGEVVEAVALPPAGAALHLFLVDTGIPRRAGDLIARFRERWTDAGWRNAFRECVIGANERAVQAFLAGRAGELWDAVDVLSRAELDLMDAMIPAQFREPWAESLEDEGFRIKLCGAGGGGFLMAWARDAGQLEARFSRTRIELVYSI